MGRQRRREGDVIAIDLEDGTYGFGRVLANPLYAFYGLSSERIEPIETIIEQPVIFSRSGRNQILN